MLSAEQRAVLVRIFFGWTLCAFLWRALDHALLSQLQAPVLGNAANDLIFWLAEVLKIPQLLTGNRAIATVFDTILLTSSVLVMVRPRGSFFPKVHCISALIYVIVFSTWSNDHYRPILGLLFAGVPFIFGNLQRFNFAFQGMRYFVLFIYASAGLYKVVRGSWCNTEQMTGIIEGTQLELFLAAPESWHAQFFVWLLQHGTVSWLLFVLATVMEVAFIVGFFTRRYDTWLFIAAWTLHLGFWFTMRFFAFELIVLDLALLPWEKLLSRWAVPVRTEP